VNQATTIAVPTETGGLDGRRSAHFGHADSFTLVMVDSEGEPSFSVIANPPHVQGGCMRTVALLAGHDVGSVIVTGIGGGPLAGLRQAGITVYFDDEHPVVRDAVTALLAGQLAEIKPGQACRGH